MRLPGMRNGGLPTGRPESATAPLRGPATNDLDSFDRALQRSADARPAADPEPARNARAPQPQRPADGAQIAQRTLDAARERSRAAERIETQHREQRQTGERGAERPAEAAASPPAAAARATGAGAGAHRTDAQPGTEAPAVAAEATDATATPDVPVDATSKDSETKTSGEPQTAADAAPLAVGTFAEVTRSLIAAAAAGSLSAASANAAHGKPGDAAETTTAAAVNDDFVADAVASGPVETLHAQADAKDATAPAGKHLPKGAKSEPAIDPQGTATPADVVRTPARDRLLEDFERRFESSLARAAGTQGGSPMNPAGPLAAAGLPASPPPSTGSMTVAYAGVAAPIGHPSFGNDLAHRVLLFAGQRVQAAEISVTPGELGPIRVSIDVRGQEATMQFSATHPTTRAAIEDALPRLREMLAAQGLQLAHANVGEHAPRHSGGSRDGQSRHDGGHGRDGGRSAPAAIDAGRAEPTAVRRVGLIDIRV